MGRLAAFIVILVGAVANIHPALAQSINETIGFVSEKLTAGHMNQALTQSGECAATFRAKDGDVWNFDLKNLSKSSLRMFSVDDNSGPIISSNPPKQYRIELQCFESDCFNNPAAKYLAYRRKIEMIIIYKDGESLTKAWTHLLNQCGAKERKQLF